MGANGIPEQLIAALRPVTIIVGHYGTGKTNLAVNLAIDLAQSGKHPVHIDLDIVNPYFRATEQRTVLEEAGVDLVAPVFSETGTSLDVPSLTGRIEPAIEGASKDAPVIIDAGGDDVGATALGRFARVVAKEQDAGAQLGYAMLVVLNKYRNLVQDPADAVENLREIEMASHLKATGLISNAHMKGETTLAHVESGLEYAQEVSNLTGLPLICATAPASIAVEPSTYSVEIYVRNPWEPM